MFYVVSGVFQPYNSTLTLSPIDTWSHVPNPCKTNAQSKLYYPHPHDTAKFIQCTADGEMYIIQCPEGKEYNPSVTECAKPAPTTVRIIFYNTCIVTVCIIYITVMIYAGLKVSQLSYNCIMLTSTEYSIPTILIMTSQSQYVSLYYGHTSSNTYKAITSITQPQYVSYSATVRVYKCNYYNSIFKCNDMYQTVSLSQLS